MVSRPSNPHHNVSQTTARPATVSVLLDTTPPSTKPLFFALGFGITSWQFVEKNLCDIFKKVSTCKDDEIAAAIFYAPRDFREKLAITHFSARINLKDSPLLKEWSDIQKRLIDASELRNALAHFHTTLNATVGQQFQLNVVFVTEAGETYRLGSAETATPDLNPNIKFLLVPNASDPNEKFKGHRKATKKPMAVKDILRAQQTFQNLSNDLKALAEKIPPQS